MTNEQFQTPVFRPTAHAFFDDFTEAVEAHFAAIDKLISLAGQHEAFAELKKSTDEARPESLACVFERRVFTRGQLSAQRRSRSHCLFSLSDASSTFADRSRLHPL